MDQYAKIVAQYAGWEKSLESKDVVLVNGESVDTWMASRVEVGPYVTRSAEAYVDYCGHSGRRPSHKAFSTYLFKRGIRGKKKSYGNVFLGFRLRSAMLNSGTI